MGLCLGLAWHDKEEIEGLICAMTRIPGFGAKPIYVGLVPLCNGKRAYTSLE